MLRILNSKGEEFIQIQTIILVIKILWVISSDGEIPGGSPMETKRLTKKMKQEKQQHDDLLCSVRMNNCLGIGW